MAVFEELNGPDMTLPCWLMELETDVVLCNFVAEVCCAMVIVADGGLVLEQRILVDLEAFFPAVLASSNVS
jgi:hypothetical protein